jgi:hypothetical protein
MAGMVGAMLATLLAVGAFIGLRAVGRDQTTVEQEPVDYLSAVRNAEDAGVQVVHPRELPRGWVATSVDLASGDRPTWGMGVLTEEGRFVGLRQADVAVEELVETYVDEEATQGGEARLDSDVGDAWQQWSDEGGDTGYSTEVDGESVLVYGSAPADELEALVGLLTK